MNNNPLVYIILPCYNGEKYLLEQLMSVYYQNYTNWYLIFINDGSTDNSETIARDWITHYNLHNKVKIINKENWWLNSAITRWLEEVKKLCNINNTDNLVTYCDADDIFTRDKLEIQVDYMVKNPEYWMTYHKAIWIDKNCELINPYPMDHYYHEDSFLYAATITNRYNAPTMVFKAKYIDLIIPMPLWKRMAQDFRTGLTLWLNNVKTHFIDKGLFYRRCFQWSMARNYEKKSKIEQWKIRMENFDLLKKRFPNKDINYVYRYNYDRYIAWEEKWYWRIRTYLLMLLKYPKIFYLWLKCQIKKSLKL